jgi:hypothetical protein
MINGGSTNLKVDSLDICSLLRDLALYISPPDGDYYHRVALRYSQRIFNHQPQFNSINKCLIMIPRLLVLGLTGASVLRLVREDWAVEDIVRRLQDPIKNFSSRKA